MTSNFVSVFITTASYEEAKMIAQVIVEENLAACATLMQGLESTYRWEDKIEQAHECGIIAKTRADKFEVLQKRVKAIHSYECPCIIAWPIVVGNEDYLEWLKGNV